VNRNSLTNSEVGQWLEVKLKREHLSLRRAAAKTNVSHATIADIISGHIPKVQTITKLAQGFGGDGERGLALKDRLFVLAGYRREHTREVYLRTIPLLSPEHQHLIKVLVREQARIEGIKISGA